MSYRTSAEDALRAAYGADAEFRRGQLDAILALTEERRRALVVQRTGWGKSVVYFIATRLMRDEGWGPTLIVSPLLALMRDQIRSAEMLGLRAVTLNSSNNDEWGGVEAEILDGHADLVLVAPERFNNPRFREKVLGELLERAGLLVIDEAHCISDWGHDFRPDYRRLVRVVSLLPPGVPVLATTATANTRVISDVEEQLGPNMLTLRGPLARDSLELGSARIDSKAARLAWLAQAVPRLPGSGIVYALTIDDAQRLNRWFERKGISALAYHGSMDKDSRSYVEAALRDNQAKVVCATSALGMGFDKPDLGFVIHFQSPGSPVDYYQQVGRAGRGIGRATGILLAGREDQAIWDYFLDTSIPLQADAQLVVEALARQMEWMTLPSLEGVVNIPRGRLQKLIALLKVEGAVEREGSSYRRTLAPWSFDAERFERVRALRLAEQAAMREYAESRRCRMGYLQAQLDDPVTGDCGRCDNCRGRHLVSMQIEAADLAEAAEFLRDSNVTVERRIRGIAPGCQLKPGRALCTLSDGGWGDSALAAKRAQELPDETMLEAFAQLVRRWDPEPSPTWITFVPNRDPKRQFVQRLAHDLGVRLALPVRAAVEKVRNTQPQKLMKNSAQQQSNVRGAYRAVVPMVDEGPVLLVDDLIGSRWTVTVIGELLRESGSGPVFPVALATSHR